MVGPKLVELLSRLDWVRIRGPDAVASNVARRVPTVANSIATYPARGWRWRFGRGLAPGSAGIRAAPLVGWFSLDWLHLPAESQRTRLLVDNRRQRPWWQIRGPRLLLTFLFGPLGLFYASISGGIIMLGIEAAIHPWVPDIWRRLVPVLLQLGGVHRVGMRRSQCVEHPSHQYNQPVLGFGERPIKRPWQRANVLIRRGLQ